MGGLSNYIGIALSFDIYIFVVIRYWRKGTSFEKSKKNLVVVNKDTGVHLSGGSMFLRETVGKWISGLILSLGFIWILIDKDKQGWHDKRGLKVLIKSAINDFLKVREQKTKEAVIIFTPLW